MKKILSFLTDLSANNNRDWFNANKSRYLEVKQDTEAFAARLIAGISEFEPGASNLSPSDCTYRIYRDTRFSSDKTPYKNHIGIYVNPNGGKKSQLAGYYIHLEPGNIFAAGGIWCPPAPVLKAIRKSIYENIEEYLEIIENPEFSRYYPVIGENLLKTAPKGFGKDWEHISLLKPRDYTTMSAISCRSIQADKCLEEAMTRFRVLKPFNDFLSYTFEENPELPRFF